MIGGGGLSRRMLLKQRWGERWTKLVVEEEKVWKGFGGDSVRRLTGVVAAPFGAEMFNGGALVDVAVLC